MSPNGAVAHQGDVHGELDKLGDAIRARSGADSIPWSAMRAVRVNMLYGLEFGGDHSGGENAMAETMADIWGHAMVSWTEIEHQYAELLSARTVLTTTLVGGVSDVASILMGTTYLPDGKSDLLPADGGDNK